MTASLKTLLPKSSSMLAIRDSSSKVISLLKAFQRRGKAALLSVALLVKRVFFAFTKKRATARTNEIHLTAPLLLTTSIAARKGFVKGFFCIDSVFSLQKRQKKRKCRTFAKSCKRPECGKNGRWCESCCSQPEADEAKKCRMRLKMQETGRKYSETDKHRRTRFPLTKKRKSIIVLGRVLHRLEMHSSRQGRGKTMSFPVHPWKEAERAWLDITDASASPSR